MVWEYALTILLLSLVVLIYLSIPVILKFRETLKKLNQTLDIVNSDLPEVMENVRDISESIYSISGKVEDTVEDIVELEQLFSKEIKDPLQNIANSIGMLLQLVNKLFDKKTKK